MIFPPSTQRSRANYPLKYAGRGKLLFIKGTSLGRDQNQCQNPVLKSNWWCSGHIIYTFVSGCVSDIQKAKYLKFFILVRTMYGITYGKKLTNVDSVHHERRTSTNIQSVSNIMSLVRYHADTPCVRSICFPCAKNMMSIDFYTSMVR
jgi:hypothetical protein